MDTPTTDSSPPQQQQKQQAQQQQGVVPSGGPQVRSRITVVCGECKRLKLKCDRKNPCGSCEKRDTIARCIYSPAAAEKVDLHSLNNRLSVVESQLAQMGTSGSRSYNHHGGSSGSGPAPNDRALIAVGSSGSSLTIPLEDVTAIWLEQLDLNKDLFPAQIHSSLSFAPHSHSQTKVPTNSIPIHSGTEPPAAMLLPPPSVYYSFNSSGYEATVTPQLIAFLPSSSSKRRKLCNSVEEILTINPCFNWKNFRERLDGMFRWAADTDTIDRTPQESGSSPPRPASKVETARAIFFGEPLPGSRTTSEPRPTISFFAAVAGVLAVGAQANRDQTSHTADEINGTLVDDILLNGRPPSTKGPNALTSGTCRKLKTSGGTKLRPLPNSESRSRTSPATLFALSEQALGIFEKSNVYDLDYLVALIMHALYMLHDGKAVLDHRLYPLVGKMVNIARMMGLGMDPDEFPGKYSLFEAEARRRIWWEIYSYDLYVSDSMGHPPAIPDNSYTTKMPVDVDEAAFSPSSSSIPTPSSDDHASKYFGLKLRMAQLVKSFKKRTLKDPLTDTPLSDSAAIEEAASFEGEVTNFLKDLPAAFKLDIDADWSTHGALPPSPSFQFSVPSPAHSSLTMRLVAQQCELVITGQRLILKIYLPFLRPNHTTSALSASHNQAALGTINAAHAIIHASKALHGLCKQSSGATSKRPGPSIFAYYSFGQALFEAAVVCAHSVITQPTAIWAKVALDNVVGALEMMRDPEVVTGHYSTSGVVSEPVKVIELLKRKADGVRAGNGASPDNSGPKRKHAEVETNTDRLLPGFQLPYVGAAVVSPGSGSSSAEPSSSPTGLTPSVQPIPDSPQANMPCNGSEVAGVRRTESEKVKSKRERRGPYPMVGIRVRPGRDGSPLVRQRPRADSTASTSSFIESDVRMQVPSPMTSRRPTPVPINHSFTIPPAQESLSMYQPPPPADSMQPPVQPELALDPHSDYTSSFANGDNSNLRSRRKFTIHDTGPPQIYSNGTPNPMSVFDQGQSNSFPNASSPVSFHSESSDQSPLAFGGGPVGYFAPSPYQPNSENGSQGSLLGLGLTPSISLDNTSDMNCSITTSSGDMMFDVKPQNDHRLQQSFVHPHEGWQHDTGCNPNGVPFWQTDYKPYFST